MKKILFILCVAFVGCAKEPTCLECVKGSDVVIMCDGEHSREAYLYQSNGYTCTTHD